MVTQEENIYESIEWQNYRKSTAHFLFFEKLSTHIWHFCKPHKSTRKPKLAKQPNYSNALERYLTG
jgi:hypothetical protein